MLNYHRIWDAEADPHGICVSPAIFAQQIKHLQKHYRLLTPEEFHELKVRRRSFPKKSVLISFDDGYSDNLTHALPVLQDARAQAIFNITTGRIDSDDEFWWDRLARVFLGKESRPKQLEITIGSKVLRLKTETPLERFSAHAQIYPLVKTCLPEARTAVMQSLSDWASIHGSSDPSSRSMTSEEILRLSRSSAAKIGAHGHSHTPLSLMPSERAHLDEISRSLQILEKITGNRILYFSFPHGGKGEYTKENMNSCADLGVQLTFSNIYGQVHSSTPVHELPRVSIGNWSMRVFESRMARFFWF